MSGRGADEMLPDQLALMCRLIYFPAAATVPAAAVVTLAMGPSVGVAARAAWVVALGALALARVTAARRYLSRPRSPAQAQRWRGLLLGLTALVGCAWSFGGTLLLPIDQPVRESLTAMCLIAALAAGFSALSPVSSAYAALAVPFVLPMTAWQIRTGYLPRQILGVVYLFFLLVMIGAAERTARATREQLRLARENAELAARLRAERDALDRANAQLRLASDAKTRFLAHMSHELRTPLTVILGYSDLLLRDAPERRSAEALARIRSAGSALLAIVNDLLDVASIEAGRLMLHEADFSPAELLGAVVAQLQSQPEARDLEITHALGGDLPARLRADHERLRQVLLNLGSNALRFTPRGRVALSMRRAAGDAGELVLRFEVTDTGIGIAPTDQERLFKAFQQADSSTTRRFGGTGLGLAICRQLVGLMDGKIGVASTPDEGATFWFELDLPRQATTESARASTTTASLDGRRALIVDDNATNRLILRKHLRAWGMEVIEASDGTEALTLAVDAAGRGEPLDLAVLDLNMPGMDGLELAERLHSDEATAGAALFLLSSSGERLSPAERERRGILASLVKPVRVSELLDSIMTGLVPEPSTMSSEDTTTKPAALAGRHVLIVEDNVMNQLVASRVIESLGCTFDIAGNGRLAVEAVREKAYDAVLMDCQMPEMDGYEATAKIRELEIGVRHTPIIAMTAAAMHGDREACIAAGMDDYLTKPLRLEALTETLLRWTAASASAPSDAEPPFIDPVGEDVRPSGEAAPVLDPERLETLRALDDGDGHLLTELGAQFLAQATEVRATLGDAAETGNAGGLVRAAHLVKGAAANLGATTLAAVCGDLERCADDGHLEAVPPLLARFDKELALVRTALEASPAEPAR
jgi:two-component system, sensor histidine kinase and response regulator